VDTSANPLCQLTFSPNSQHLATISDQALQICAAETGVPVQSIGGLSYRATQLAFSPDGQWVAANSLANGTVGVWGVNGGSLRFEAGRYVSRLSFSRDGQWLATAARQGNARLQLWRLSNGTLAQTLQGHQLDISALAFSPDGQMLASGEGGFSGSSTAVRLWRISDGTLLHTLGDHPNRIADLLFSADGQMLYAASGDTVYAWRVGDGALAGRYAGHTDYVYSLALSPDGAQLATGSFDGTVRLWPAR
jgi:WD40 repeat protein